jgi:hypothetical protein
VLIFPVLPDKAFTIFSGAFFHMVLDLICISLQILEFLNIFFGRLRVFNIHKLLDLSEDFDLSSDIFKVKDHVKSTFIAF